ncbi:MAG: hypothetical protein ACI4XJ_04140 [Eubacteriales bacterium]
MVSLVWFVLSLFGVCRFSWIPLFIESIIAMFGWMIRNSNSTDTLWSLLEVTTYCGIILFSFCKMTFDLSISSWWILVSPIWFEVASLFPGGFTITSILFNKYGLMNVPLWGLIVSILVDVSILILIVVEFFQTRETKKSKNNF